MSSEPVIEFDAVHKRYRLGAAGSLWGLLSRKRAQDFWALQGLSFTVRKGEVYGIIGPNGAGKSTILKLLAGVTSPDRGQVRIDGRIAPLIELGAGFHPDLSGRENVYLNGALMGLSRAEIDRRYEDIVAFAELAEFMHTPVKKYSSGMFIRLGFSLAVHTDPEVLLVDEVLSVGDERFQRKCVRKFLQFREQGKTIVVVSHDLGLVSGICTNMLFLAQGKAVAQGSVEQAIGRYLQTMGEDEGVEVLQEGQATLVFNNGRASLFCGGREVTKKLGLYTSMLVNGGDLPGAGVWHDSTKAVWRCTRIDARTVRCRGEYISAPLVQEWEISLDERGVVKWSVVLEVLAPVRIERRQANAMLSEAYRTWSGGDARGGFPPEFTSRDYHNWEILASPPGASMIAAGAESLPEAEFSATASEFAPTIVNSNFLFSGRVLMYLALEPVSLGPGRYPYFSGELRLRQPPARP
jgi:ABC-type polysaccharide/polyol phosphate transport system ATPase subunit